MSGERQPANVNAGREEKGLRQALPALVVLLVSFAYVVVFQHFQQKKILLNPPYYGTEYTVDRGSRLVPLSLGNRLWLADFFWMRSIQTFGGMYRTTRDYKPLFNLFFIISDLDPYFLEGYKFGNLAIGDEGGDQELGIKLMDRGMYKNPEKYRLPYEAAFCLVYQMEKTEKNRRRALFYINRAIKAADCPEHVKRFRDDILSMVGLHVSSARESLRGLLMGYDNKDDIYYRDIYFRRLTATVHRWQLDLLVDAAKRFKQKEGRDIQSVQELFDWGLGAEFQVLDMPLILKQIEYYRAKGEPLLPHFEEVYSKALVSRNQVPSDPRNLDKPDQPLRPYTVVRGLTSDQDGFIQSEDDVMDKVQRLLLYMRARLEEYWKKNGRLSEKFQDALPDGAEIPQEPFGGEWIYQPHVPAKPDAALDPGVIRSSTHPEL